MGLASSLALSCSMFCTGNSSQICGGENANSVYRISISIGCFSDCGTAALPADDLAMNSLNSANMTTQICLASCRTNNFKYAGLQSGWLYN